MHVCLSHHQTVRALLESAVIAAIDDGLILPPPIAPTYHYIHTYSPDAKPIIISNPTVSKVREGSRLSSSDHHDDDHHSFTLLPFGMYIYRLSKLRRSSMCLSSLMMP